jgi:hypothetical protein
MKLVAEIKSLENRLARKKLAGWDGVQTDADVMDVLKRSYPKINWLLKDRDAVYGVMKDDYVVALYELKKDHGQRWVYTKAISGKMGPFQRPPEKFWNMSEVKNYLSKERIEFEKNADPTQETWKGASKVARKFDLGAGHLGNGVTVWNKAKEVHGDYETIAHISHDRKISWKLKNPPKEVVEYVESIAEGPNFSASTSQPHMLVFSK